MATAAGTDVDLHTGQLTKAILPSAVRWRLWWQCCGEQFATERQLCGAVTIGKEADVADAMKTAGHGVLQEATDELVGGERHHLGLAVLTIVLPGEADSAIVEPEQTAVGDGNAVSVAPEIAEYLLGSGEWGFGEDDPVDFG